MAIGAVSSAAPVTNALGLDFPSLLKIILTQLTYQDPLKPVENFEFVSQLAQFAALQQTQQLNQQITSLLSLQGATQATSLLGRRVDFNTATQAITGTVQSISFAQSEPLLTVQTTDGQTFANVSLTQVVQVR